MFRSGTRGRSKGALLGSALSVLAVAGAAAFAMPGTGIEPSSAKSAAQAASGCTAAPLISIDRDPVALGDTVEATLVVSVTCEARRLPVDLVIVGDESFSMLRRQPSGPGGPGRSTPTPTPGRGGGPATPGSGGEPAFCSAGGPGSTPTTDPRMPTPTPDPNGTPRGPGGPPDPLEARGADDLLREEKSFVHDLLDHPVIKRDLATDRLRIGFVSFAGQVKVNSTLSHDATDVTNAANRMRGFDLSNVKLGLQEAARTLAGSSSRSALGETGRVTIVVLMSDFQFCKRDMRGSALDPTTDVVAVGFGRDVNRMNQVAFASDASMALGPTDIKEFIHLYDDVIAPPAPVGLTTLKVSDRLHDNMRLDPASVRPTTATITGQLIEWPLPAATLPQTLTYRVAPQEAGVWSISESAGIEWTDSEGLAGAAPFPDVVVEVLPQTATPQPPTPTDTPTTPPTANPTAAPTATPSATARPTRVPEDLYLPVAYRNWPECIPGEQTIDVALVIDTSGSMRDPTQPGGAAKIDAAIAAGGEVVKLLKATDQAAIVGFNSTSTVAAALTNDKARLAAALQALKGTMAGGTLIDTGLKAATDELLGPRHSGANQRSIILVTDGEQANGQTAPVLALAAGAKAAGISIITVGLGPEIDEALLRRIASAPNLYFAAPDAAELLQIYREVARIIPCP